MLVVFHATSGLTWFIGFSSLVSFFLGTNASRMHVVVDGVDFLVNSACSITLGCFLTVADRGHGLPIGLRSLVSIRRSWFEGALWLGVVGKTLLLLLLLLIWNGLWCQSCSAIYLRERRIHCIRVTLTIDDATTFGVEIEFSIALTWPAWGVS